MIRYNYNRQFDPPAPFVYVTLCHPTDPTKIEQVPALMDSGASITAIPEEVIDRLGLAPVGDALVGGFRGPEQAMETYSLTLILHSWTFTSVKVVASDESYVWLGRDVLNQFVTILDGKRLILELREDSTD